MLRIELLIGGQVYRFASEALDFGGYYWQPRINNTFDIQRVFSFTDKTGNRRRSISIVLDNNDKFFNTLHDNYSLLNKQFTIYFDDGSNLTKKLVGNCVEILKFDFTINITISESINIFLDQPIPDAQIAYDYYSDTGINESWNAIPIVFGNVKRLRVAWVNKVAQEFMICSGEIFKVEKVYFDKQIMYDADTGLNGYQSLPETGNIKVRIFKGSGSVGNPEIVEGHTSNWVGFAYIQFYDANTGNPVEPKMTDGKVPEIFVDVKGIINDAKTDCERNPAIILHKLLSYPTTGYNGFGLGVPTDKLNFGQAIGYCTMQEYKMDGVIDQKMNATEWIDEITKSFAGSLIEEEGVFHLLVDKQVDLVSAEFDESGELGHNIILDGFEEPNLDSQINRLRLFYDTNYENGKFDKRPETNEESPCGSTQLRNEDHALKIEKWNTGTLELPLIKDDVTAHKIGQLYFKRNILQLKTISFTTEVNVATTLDVRQKIRLTSQRFNWTQKEFIIQEIIKGEKGTRISCKEYSSAVYTYVNDITIPVLDRPMYGKYDIPAKPINLSISVSVSAANDGKLVTTLNLTALKVGDNVNRILFYRKSNLAPESSFTYFASSETGTLQYIWDLPDGNYNIRAIAMTPYGVGSSLTVSAGDTHYYGQPGAETYISILTQKTVDYQPQAPHVNVYFKTIRVKCKQNLTKEKDVVGFEIWRQEVATRTTSPNVALASYVGKVSTHGQYEDVIYLDESTDYGKFYYYWVKTINNSGSVSAFSPSHYNEYNVDSYAIETFKIKTFDIAPLAIELGQVAPGAITCTNIQDCAITTPKLAAYAVVAGKIAACSLCSFHVGTNELIANEANIACAIIGYTRIYSVCADTVSTGNLCADNACVAGWRLKPGCMYSGNLHFVASGGMCGNYVAGSQGWAIKNDGSAEFSNVVARGTICSNAGNIGGWQICPACLYYDTGTGITANISTNFGGLPVFYNNYLSGGTTFLASMGRMYWNSGFQNGYGFAAVYQAGNPYFAAGRASFGNVTLPNSTVVSTDNPFFWVGDSSNYMSFANGRLKIGVANSEDANAVVLSNSSAASLPLMVVGSAGASAIIASSTTGVALDGRAYYGLVGGVSASNQGFCNNSWAMTARGDGLSHGICAIAYGARYGVYAVGGDGYAIEAHAYSLATGWKDYGIVGCARDWGILGYDQYTVGVYGYSGCGWGVYGTAGTTSGVGVVGIACSYGVRGLSYCNHGVFGVSQSNASAGVYGFNDNGVGVWGNSTNNNGVIGFSTNAIGIYGCSANSYGIFGYNSGVGGVIGCSSSGYGVVGYSTSSCGVAGNTPYFNFSSKELKRGFEDIEVLSKIANLSIKKWMFHDRNHRSYGYYVGPVAEEYSDVFGFDFDSNGISGMDGVALKGVQELHECNTALQNCLNCYINCLQTLENRLSCLEKK